ncbi:DUF4179 domain-containing protein [Aneurinibacillus uraniidurans]|uniref:DUF4179 domain-containing protein n=1 Tax=Aneurinibacillus uraniidurans TaxID=2966586 RepID=UPI00234BA7A4|nr:DUF4179 domain-containing protein [Aneurinibacillus sp. B1]WCN37923.1 DUF4179 domain-containing protein [Aneurinibacillus sp. B1]
MKSESDLKVSLEQSFDQIHVPESLYQFAEELPERFEAGEYENIAQHVPTSTTVRPSRFLSGLVKSATVAAILVLAFPTSATISSAFATLVKGVPGIEIAVDWLRHVRENDGVQNAIDNEYIPIEPVTRQIGGTTITISDIYLTDEELLFKTFIRTNEFDVTDTRGTVRLNVYPDPENLRGGGSTTASSLVKTTDGNNKPVLQESYKYQLEEGAAADFLAKNRKLTLVVDKNTFNHGSKKLQSKELGKIVIPLEPNKLLHNKVVETKQILPIDDRDWEGLTLEKLTIQPTTMNVIMKGKKEWNVYFPWEENIAPYLKDDKGKIYRYDPSGPGLLLEAGKQQLSFSSSVFFDSDVRTMYLHVGEIFVTEHTPSGSFNLSMNDTFPKTVRFKNHDIVIEGVEYHPEGYIHVKIRKENAKQKYLEGLYFDSIENKNVNRDELNEKIERLMKMLKIDGLGHAKDYHKTPYLSLYIPVSHQGRYTISISRANDRIIVNKDYPIQLK